VGRVYVLNIRMTNCGSAAVLSLSEQVWESMSKNEQANGIRAARMRLGERMMSSPSNYKKRPQPSLMDAQTHSNCGEGMDQRALRNWKDLRFALESMMFELENAHGSKEQ
jgi:hypothetical protein